MKRSLYITFIAVLVVAIGAPCAFAQAKGQMTGMWGVDPPFEATTDGKKVATLNIPTTAGQNMGNALPTIKTSVAISADGGASYQQGPYVAVPTKRINGQYVQSTVAVPSPESYDIWGRTCGEYPNKAALWIVKNDMHTRKNADGQICYEWRIPKGTNTVTVVEPTYKLWDRLR